MKTIIVRRGEQAAIHTRCRECHAVLEVKIGRSSTSDRAVVILEHGAPECDWISDKGDHPPPPAPPPYPNMIPFPVGGR